MTMSILDRKKREQKERRQTILTAAKRLFSRMGIEGTSMSRIAEEAELSKGALYLYFRRKESIVYEILYSYLRDMQEKILKAETGAKNGYEKAGRILEAFSGYYHSHGEFLSLSRYLDYQSKSAQSISEEARRCFSVIDELRGHAVALIEEGQRDGSIRKSLDPGLTATTIVHVVESSLLKCAADPILANGETAYEPKRIVDHLLDMILSSLHQSNQ